MCLISGILCRYFEVEYGKVLYNARRVTLHVRELKSEIGYKYPARP